jgi:arginase family enzyme
VPNLAASQPLAKQKKIKTKNMIKIIQNISVEIIGADIVEYNPIRDVNNMTAMVGYKLIKELVAKMV